MARSFDGVGRQLSESKIIPATATGTAVAQVAVTSCSYNTDGLLDIMIRPSDVIVQSTYSERNQIDRILLDWPPPGVDYSYNLHGLVTGKA